MHNEADSSWFHASNTGGRIFSAFVSLIVITFIFFVCNPVSFPRCNSEEELLSVIC